MPTLIKPLPELRQKDIDRFWKYVDKNPAPEDAGPTGDCWNWTGAASKRGYGVFMISHPKTTARSVRIAYLIQHGEDPYPFEILHSCDRPRCVNGSHLRTGTRQENMDDAVKRKRMATGDRNGSRLYPERLMRGEQHHGIKNTDAEVSEMRRLYTEEKMTVTKISSIFGLSISSASKIIKGQMRGPKGATDQKSLIISGEAHYGAKANPDTVRAIRTDKANGMTYSQLNAKYGLAIYTLFAIVTRKTWKMVE